MNHLIKPLTTAMLLTTIPLLSCGEKSAKTSEKSSSARITEISYVMQFTQGESKSYQIRGSVPEPYKAIIDLNPVPEGASFDDGLLTWQPDCKIEIQNGDYHYGYMVINAQVVVRSEAEHESLPVDVVILVHRATDPRGPCADEVQIPEQGELQ